MLQKDSKDRMSSNKPTIVITGGSGLLGLNWGFQLHNHWNVVLLMNKRFVQPAGMKAITVDFGSIEDINKLLDEHQAELLVHTAGLTSIEVCESNPDLARLVNTTYSENIAKACKACKIPMIHVSTDNLFDGSSTLVTESHPINPLNVYGRTKADAELCVQDVLPDALIVRTNFYGWGPPYKKSFSDAIIDSLRNNKNISLFEDVYYTPILISELIRSSHELLTNGFKGVFHLCGDERLTKFQFGKFLAKTFQLDENLILPGKLETMKNLVARPLDMSMSNKKAADALGRKMGTVVDHLNQLKNQENTPSKRELDEIHSLR